jgi:hypothetical protein
MSAIWGITWDLGLLALACLPAIIAFWRGQGIFRYFALGTCLFGLAWSFPGSLRGGGEGIYFLVHLIPGWLVGSSFAAIAINQATPRDRP